MNLIIFSDIDGTLYSGTTTTAHAHPFEINAQTLIDIKAAQDLGVEFILCTGNPFFEHMNKLAQSLNTKWMISSNGAGIVDVKAQKYVLKSMVPRASVQRLVDAATAIGLSSDWWDEAALYFNSVTPPKLVEWWSKREGFVVRTTDKVLSDCFKLEFHHEDNPQLLDQMEVLLDELKMQHARMSPVHIEITAPGISKGFGIKWMAKHLNIKLEDVMGVGDSANDLPMFEVVGHAYAMANGPQKVKDAAHHQTASVEQNGLGMAIVDFLHRKGYRQS